MLIKITIEYFVFIINYSGLKNIMIAVNFTYSELGRTNYDVNNYRHACHYFDITLYLKCNQ